MNNQVANTPPYSAISFFCFIFLLFISTKTANGYNLFEKKDSLIKCLHSAPNNEQKSILLLALSTINLSTNTDSAIFFAQEAVDLSNKVQKWSLYVSALQHLGKAYSQKGDPNSALIYYKKALEISQQEKSNPYIATNWSNIGGIYEKQGRYTQALLAFFKSLQHIDTLNQVNEYVTLLNHIGLIYSRQNNPKQALQYYLNALTIIKQQNQLKEEASLLSEIGCVYFDLEQNDLGLDYHLKAANLFLQTDDNEGLAQCYACIAHSYLDKKLYSTALNYAKKGTETAEKSQSPSMKAHTQIRLAQIYGAMKQVEKAISLAESGLEIALSAKDKSQERMAYLILKDIYQQEKQFEKAFLYGEKAQEVYAYLQNSDKIQEITDLQSTYELEIQQQITQNTLKLMNEKNNKELLYWRFVITVGILLFCLLCVLLVAFYEKNKSESKLAEMNADIREQAAKLDLKVKERTRELEISQANILAIMNNTKDSIWSIDQNLNMITLNKPLQEGILGEMAHLVKPYTNIKDILPHEQYLFWKEKYERCLKGEHFNFEFSFQKKTHESTYEVSLNPIRDENNEIVGASTFCREITRRKQQETEKMKLIQTLTESNKDLEQFAYIVSHNLRAPIARMGGLMEIFNKNDISDPINQFVFDNLAKSATELDGITHDLNTIVSVRSHTDEKRSQILLSTVFSQVQKALQHDLELVNAQVNCDFSAIDSLCVIKGYMYSILQNLLTNSLKYRQLEQILEVKIWTEKKGNYVKLYFQDNGMGIDLEKNRQKVFGLYNRFHPQIKGKGIGLHIIKAQVEIMNGSINIESRVNEGTKFEISFPNQTS